MARQVREQQPAADFREARLERAREETTTAVNRDAGAEVAGKNEIDASIAVHVAHSDGMGDVAPRVNLVAVRAQVRDLVGDEMTGAVAGGPALSVLLVRRIVNGKGDVEGAVSVEVGEGEIAHGLDSVGLDHGLQRTPTPRAVVQQDPDAALAHQSSARSHGHDIGKAVAVEIAREHLGDAIGSGMPPPAFISRL